MLYDVAVKKAERLLRRNFASVQVEAHRLAGLGLPNLSVNVTEGSIRLTIKPDTLPRGAWAEITPNEVVGGWLIQWQDGHWEQDGNQTVSGLEAVATLLQAALEEAQNLALRMGEVREELAKVN